MITKFNIFEKFKTPKDLYLPKYDIKKYIITRDKSDLSDDYYLDEILNFDDDNIKVRTICVYNVEDDIVSKDVYIQEYMNYSFLEEMLFSFDNIDDAKKKFYEIVSVYKDVKKYNL